MNSLKDKISLKEIARDIIALGSPIFFVLVVARIYLLSNFEYLSQFLIAGILFLVLFFIFKADIYSGLGLIVLIFTMIYYNDLKFGIFGTLLYAALILSLVYLNKGKKEILLGVVLGAVSALISYFAVKMIFT